MFAKLFSNRTENGFGSRHAVAYRETAEEQIASQPPIPITPAVNAPSLPPAEDVTILQVKRTKKPAKTLQLEFVEPCLLKDRDGHFFLYKGSTIRKTGLYKVQFYTKPNLHRSFLRSEVEIYGEAFFI
jgi:hypothetical protein